MLKCLVLTNHLFLPDLSDYPNLVLSSSKNNTATKVLSSPSLQCNFFPGMSPFYSFFSPWSPLHPSLTRLNHDTYTSFPSILIHLPWGYPFLSFTALRSNQPLAQSTEKITNLMAAHTGTLPFLPANPIQRTISPSKPASNLPTSNGKDWADDI